jgi:hypothetical protein
VVWGANRCGQELVGTFATGIRGGQEANLIMRGSVGIAEVELDADHAAAGVAEQADGALRISSTASPSVKSTKYQYRCRLRCHKICS